MGWIKVEDKLPPLDLEVLLLIDDNIRNKPYSVSVGYLRKVSGEKTTKFITPGGVGSLSKVIEWCDCLNDNFEWPRLVGG